MAVLPPVRHKALSEIAVRTLIGKHVHENVHQDFEVFRERIHLLLERPPPPRAPHVDLLRESQEKPRFATRRCRRIDGTCHESFPYQVGMPRLQPPAAEIGQQVPVVSVNSSRALRGFVFYGHPVLCRPRFDSGAVVGGRRRIPVALLGRGCWRRFGPGHPGSNGAKLMLAPENEHRSNSAVSRWDLRSYGSAPL
jgi:hypothetical protein